MQKALTGRAGDWIRANRAPRAIMCCAFAASMASAWTGSSWLLAAGVQSLSWRFAICFALAYVVFLLVVSAWYLHMPSIGTRELLEDADHAPLTRDPTDVDVQQSPWAETFNREFQQALQRNPPQGASAMAALCIVAAIVGALIVAIHWIRYAPWNLGQLLVLGGKVQHRSIRADGAAPWLGVLLSQTRWVAIILFLHYVAIGVGLQLTFPQATTVMEVIQAM